MAEYVARQQTVVEIAEKIAGQMNSEERVPPSPEFWAAIAALTVRVNALTPTQQDGGA